MCESAIYTVCPKLRNPIQPSKMYRAAPHRKSLVSWSIDAIDEEGDGGERGKEEKPTSIARIT